MEQQQNLFFDLLTDGLDEEKKEIASRIMEQTAQHLLEYKNEYKYNFYIVVFPIIYRLVRDNGEFEFNPKLMYETYCEVYESITGDEIEERACALTCEKLKDLIY